MEADEKIDLASAFQEAARIAQLVPEQFRDAAFQRALDTLLGPIQASGAPSAPPANPFRGRVSADAPAMSNTESELDRLLREVDSSAHPEIHDSANLQDQCLMVLLVMKNEYHVDGLTTSEVGKLLTTKFRVKAGERSIRRALSESGRLVDRVPEGKGFRYRIMTAGEQHIAALAPKAGQDRAPGMRSGARTPIRNRQARRSAPEQDSLDSSVATLGASASTTTRKLRDSTARGAGPSAHIRGLIAAGWFSSARTVNDLLKEMARRGLHYKRTDLTRQMITLVRSGELARNQVADGVGRAVWHYTAPNA